MKTSVCHYFNVVLLAVVFVWAAGGGPPSAFAQTPPAPTNVETAVAPATPVAPPPDIFPTSPLAQVVRLTQAGVDQSIIMNYVTNSTSTFNLDSDRIIYLTNIGAPNTLITAMMERDRELQQQFAAAQQAQQEQQSPPPTVPSPVPEAPPANTTDVTPVPAPEPPVTVNYFYNTLSPYGSWVVVNGYGPCWRPTVCVYNPGWQPYCDNGHWVYTDYGWFWASGYAWGATFHYGRWFLAAGHGWCWCPDTVWAPSWVTWRYSSAYCGWAPLPPRTSYRAGVGIVYNGGNVSVGFGFGLGANCFTFVPTAYFCNLNPRNFCVPRAQVTQIYNNTTVINNYNVNNHTVVNHGIAVENIAAAGRTTIHSIPVQQINSPMAYVNHGQPGHPGYNPGANHATGQRDFGSPLRTPGSPQSYYSPQPQQNSVVAMSPQHSEPVANDYASRAQVTRTETLPANDSNPKTTTAYWQPTGTPRNQTHDYESHQNYNHSSANAAPQHSSNYSPASPSPAGGGRSGNQYWSGH